MIVKVTFFKILQNLLCVANAFAGNHGQSAEQILTLFYGCYPLHAEGGFSESERYITAVEVKRHLFRRHRF